MDTLLHDLVCNSTAFLSQWPANSEKLQSSVTARTAAAGALILRQVPALQEALKLEMQSLQQVSSPPGYLSSQGGRSSALTICQMLHGAEGVGSLSGCAQVPAILAGLDRPAELQEPKSHQQLRKEVKHRTAWLASLEKGTALLAEVVSAVDFSPYPKIAAAYHSFDLRSKTGLHIIYLDDAGAR